MNRMSWQAVAERYRRWREDNSRNSDLIVQLWEEVLCAKVDKLGDEKWMVLEQVAVAALDLHKMTVAEDCLVMLSKQFPGSQRVRKLKALRLEALERYEDANDVYDAILRKDETNTVVRKRKIAILKSLGKTSEAIRELVEYLKKFMSDTEAWMELSDLYISEQDYAKAAYCMEELLLHNPHHHLYFQKYADIKYTQGGFDNVEVARSYYSRAVKLSSANNMRALYGLLLCCSQIANSPKAQAQKKKENTKIGQWAAQCISDKYREASGSEDNQPVEQLLGALTLS
ncbi:ER membrane protein complex subunit 2-like [Amphibalanus amphitrite]|uniref:ER membrane protein complex subunit 2-like n=1 Tax=Amphibalanus amphitrite TaxID=1232801 RepID=UPI001C926CAE|nr:ER membrane protein complex subunit 2-like [Amphibalanus amphitrite]XP_043230205.1 ER membrane protein complex subunit 2-like [Amphibalanus amphitrite]XP_043230206.1 ER membrane protein complex subunit 2-like [Amphibalanus amphitrite]XP_043230207.1 ER membrane protein complex subunit 2-like [Amphibalanus amphitrite]XP_043230208.1 ER membrane protein complex subunit 2-like [Amphibalanus amphitrite]